MGSKEHTDAIVSSLCCVCPLYLRGQPFVVESAKRTRLRQTYSCDRVLPSITRWQWQFGAVPTVVPERKPIRSVCGSVQRLVQVRAILGVGHRISVDPECSNRKYMVMIRLRVWLPWPLLSPSGRGRITVLWVDAKEDRAYGLSDLKVKRVCRRNIDHSTVIGCCSAGILDHMLFEIMPCRRQSL